MAQLFGPLTNEILESGLGKRGPILNLDRQLCPIAKSPLVYASVVLHGRGHVFMFFFPSPVRLDNVV
jgi:hypothetical protein